uniref:Uncharacterized protein n=1 Tax=Arion vulgaris TaxID=1028688 RepID=A0A0B6Y0S2_9EUPU
MDRKAALKETLHNIQVLTLHDCSLIKQKGNEEGWITQSKKCSAENGDVKSKSRYRKLL